MNEIFITAGDLRACNPISLPDKAKDFSRYNFWTYTRLQTAELILASGCFRLSNLKGMNDQEEAAYHAKDQARVFALCFCNSNTEKIPMWYLYSGLSGKGAALGFTAAKMMKWLSSIKEVYAVKNGQTKADGEKLIVGKNVQLQYGWVYYQKPREPKNISYRNKWYVIDDPAAFRKDNFFIKSYPWEYEREFRIVFIAEKNTSYDALFVDIPDDIRDALKVMLAPELQEKQFHKMKKGLKHIGRTHQPIYSNLSIRMNLFERNLDNLLDCLKEELAQSDSKVKAEDICSVLQDAGHCPKP